MHATYLVLKAYWHIINYSTFNTYKIAAKIFQIYVK